MYKGIFSSKIWSILLTSIFISCFSNVGYGMESKDSYDEYSYEADNEEDSTDEEKYTNEEYYEKYTNKKLSNSCPSNSSFRNKYDKLANEYYRSQSPKLGKNRKGQQRSSRKWKNQGYEKRKNK